MDHLNNEHNYRRGNKTRLRLSTKRRSRKRVQKYKKYTIKSRSNNISPSSIDTEGTRNSNYVTPLEDCASILGLSSNSNEVVEDVQNIDLLENSVILKNETKSNELVLEGRRIVDIQHLIDSLKLAGNHSKEMGCSLDNMKIIKEKRNGLSSTITMKCNMCNIVHNLETSYDSKSVNEDAVVGIVAIGSGFAHLEQFTSSLNIPYGSHNTFDKIHNTVCDTWEETALESMADAAMQEKELAIAAGDVNENGVPFITVVCDGSWAKRSYRHQYNSLSGAAAIVGFRTRKVLHIGVRNKYCNICKRIEGNENEENKIVVHKCYKNWNGSASSMEADILVEGFEQSLLKYGVIYSKMIADGDSSCYKKILDSNPYSTQNITVQKIECTNHLMRNYIRKIKVLSETTSSGSKYLRSILKMKLKKIRTAVTEAIRYRKNEDVSFEKKIKNLKNDILNGPSHIFGEHKFCKKLSYFCQKEYDKGTDTIFSDMKLFPLYDELMEHVRYLSNHASSLIYNFDSNSVEQFNAIIAKFIGGKRINFCRKRSYQGRCSAAVVSYNTKHPIGIVTKKLTGRSPGTFSKSMEARRESQLLRDKLKNSKAVVKRKLTFENQDSGGYGLYCSKPDMDDASYQLAKDEYLLQVKKTNEEIIDIERRTRDQSKSALWKHERRCRVTASKFGEVCCKLPYTSRKSSVKSILYPKNIFTAATEHGNKNEVNALNALSVKLGKCIQKCGLCIDNHCQFLAATPDGIIDKDTIVEVKCPFSAKHLTPEEGITQRKITFWKKDGTINKNHKWYFQIQGQLHVTHSKLCYFAVWTPKGLKIEEIVRDELFWETKMKKQLYDFYYDCMLPELVDSRQNRSMEIRDPPYVLLAIKKREEYLKTRKRKLI